MIRASEVQIEDVRWRWRGRLPVGKLVILEGDPKVGKSWLALVIIAAVSRGLPLLDDDLAASYKPARSLIFSAEDGRADTLAPRLRDLGANLKRVFFEDIVGVDRHHPSLRDDLDAIEARIVADKIELIVIDPLNGYLADIDGNSDIKVRTALAPFERAG